VKTTSVASNLHNIRYYDLCNAWNVTARVAEDLGVDPGRLSMQGKVVVMDMGTAKAAQAWLNRFAAVGGCGYSAWRSCTLLQQMRGKKALHRLCLEVQKLGVQGLHAFVSKDRCNLLLSWAPVKVFEQGAPHTVYPAWKHLRPYTLQGFDYRRDMHCLEHVGLYNQQALSDARLPSFTPPSHSAAAAAARPPPPPPPPPQLATAGPAVAAAAAQPPHSHSHSQPQPQPQLLLLLLLLLLLVWEPCTLPHTRQSHPAPTLVLHATAAPPCRLLLLPMLLLLPQALAGSTLGAWLTLGTCQPPRPP